MYVPDKEDAQPTKLFALKKRTLQEALAVEVTTRVYAWRTFEKEVAHGILLASEHASNHSSWTFISGTLMTLEQLIERKLISSATAQRKRAEGYSRAVLIKDDLFAYATDKDILGPNVKK